MKRLILLMLVLTGMALFAAPANAANMKDFHRAQAIARSYFKPKCGPVVIHWVAFSERTLNADADPRTCVVNFERASFRWWWESICQTMVHEYGHLAGLGHATSQRSIMYPEPTMLPRRCRRPGAVVTL